MNVKLPWGMMLCLALAFPPVSSAQDPAAGECHRGVCFEKTREIAGSPVELKGMKLFEYLTFDVYTGAFYAPAGKTTSADVLADVPKSLVLHYHRGIKPSDMNRAAEKVLLKNPANDAAALRSRIDTIAGAYEKVGKGDRYELRYEPGRGTTLLLNGKEKVTVPGADFAAAYFGIWVSEYPINKELRDTLLGVSQSRSGR